MAILMLKEPVFGRVKTRLGREVGAELSLDLYRWLGKRQWESVPSGWMRCVRHTPDGAAEAMRRWLGGADIRLRPQGDGDLGTRMERACREAFAEGARRVVLLGGDCPSLDAEDLRGLARAMEGRDGRVAPARDGGYCALGLRRHESRLFEGIDWGGPQVLKQTLERADEAGFDLAIGEEREDIDDMASLRRCVARWPDLDWPKWARSIAIDGAEG